jgi:hypothetical protein
MQLEDNNNIENTRILISKKIANVNYINSQFYFLKFKYIIAASFKRFTISLNRP